MDTTLQTITKTGTVPKSEIDKILIGDYEKVTLDQMSIHFGIVDYNKRMEKKYLPKKVSQASLMVASQLVIASIPLALSPLISGYTAECYLKLGAIHATIFYCATIFLAYMSMIAVVFAIPKSIVASLTSWKYLSATMVVEDVEHTDVKIPYGASLRLEEACSSKAFVGFKICYPTIAELTDPAILGCHDDGSFSLIVWWDKIVDDKVFTTIK